MKKPKIKCKYCGWTSKFGAKGNRYFHYPSVCSDDKCIEKEQRKYRG